MRPLVLTLALLALALTGCYATGGGYGGGGYQYPIHSTSHPSGCSCSRCGGGHDHYDPLLGYGKDHHHGYGGMFERSGGDPLFDGYGWEQ